MYLLKVVFITIPLTFDEFVLRLFGGGSISMGLVECWRTFFVRTADVDSFSLFSTRKNLMYISGSNSFLETLFLLEPNSDSS